MNAMKDALAKKMMELKGMHSGATQAPQLEGHDPDDDAGQAPDLDDEKMEMDKVHDAASHLQGAEADMEGLKSMHGEPGQEGEGGEDHMKILSALADHHGGGGLHSKVAANVKAKMASMHKK